MGPLGMPELIMIFIVLALMAGGALAVAGIVYFVVKKTNKPPGPPTLPPQH